MSSKLQGVIPALTTPFDAAGDVDEGAFREQIKFMLGKGVHGICVGGSTGEGFALEVDELRRLTTIAVEEAAGRIPVVTGIIANSTREVLRRVAAVQDLGVAALQVTPTFYVFTTDKESTYQHFKTVSEAFDIPVLIYNVVPWNPIDTDLALRILNEIPGVVGIKQSQGNISRMAELVVNAPGGKVILAAIDNLLYACFTMGAHGTLAASPTAAPGPIVRLWNAVQQDDHETGMEIHKRLVNFWRAMPHENLPACVKYALNLQGVDVGVCRKPMPMPSSQDQIAIERALRPLLEFDTN